MRQVNLEKFRINLSQELKNLPFEVIKRGKVIAIIISPNLKVQGSNNSNLKVQTKKQNKTNLNLKVQTINSPEDVKNWADKNKLNSKGKFKTYFKS